MFASAFSLQPHIRFIDTYLTPTYISYNLRNNRITSSIPEKGLHRRRIRSLQYKRAK